MIWPIVRQTPSGSTVGYCLPTALNETTAEAAVEFATTAAQPRLDGEEEGWAPKGCANILD